jgi:methionine-rich copper-binding protein CopC
MKKQIAQRAATMVLAVAAAALAGCAAPAHKENMSAAPAAAVKKLPYSVRVETRGGSETGVMDSSNVSNADLKAALEASIAKSGLFKTVMQGKDGEYELTVTVTSLDKPIFGGAFTVTLETGWSLVKTSDKSVAMRKAVKSSHTASFSDSIVGVTRLRLALEGAVRNNITEGLQAISALPI